MKCYIARPGDICVHVKGKERASPIDFWENAFQ